ncbi:Structural protein [Pseudomonas sp. IT-P176]
MPVRLDQIPGKAPRPAPPRVWLWLVLVPLLLVAAVGVAWAWDIPAWREQPLSYWVQASGLALLLWSLLGFVRGLVHLGQQRAADGWDQAREEDSQRKTRRGRRSQQVLGVSVHTGLREAGQSPAAQLDAFLSGTAVLQSQASRQGDGSIRHSYLPYDPHEPPEQVLLQVLNQVLADLAQALVHLADDTPVALLLEIDSGLPEPVLQRVWRHAWRESGIRQSTSPLDSSGLAALDHWLDQRIADRGVLMVVAAQFAPQQSEGKAEAAVGVLLGNRLTQNTLPALAYLHRPELAREPTADALLPAVQQALNWVSLDAKAIKYVWRAGIASELDAAISTVLAQVSMPANAPQGLCNLDALLGHPGVASPWLAIAGATQNLALGAGPQFIFSADNSGQTGPWGMVLAPVPVLLTKES